VVAAVVVLAGLAATLWVSLRQDPVSLGEVRTAGRQTREPTTSTSRRSATACAEALALADDMIVHARALADAGIDHGVLMEKLELGLEGKPGGITGAQAYELGVKQVAVMEEHGPDVRATVRRYQAARRRCTTP
jgi:hypothetical protein